MKRFAILLIIFATGLSLNCQNPRVLQVLSENQPIADQGNGYYLNPIIAGNYGDPSLVRVGEDYYMAFSRGDGMIIWHSKDLMNWKPLVHHKFPEGFTGVWAVDLQYYDGLFHLYIPVMSYTGKNTDTFGNFVVTAKKPEGPWSEPKFIDISKPANAEGFSAIDPGFIMTPDGEKYLYVNHGYVVKLNDSGDKAIGKPIKVYDGWAYPESWNVQCMCLESPKLFIKDGYYYLVSAQGGTSGPSTAHMTVVARSKSPLGPWINSPYNPVTHTYSNDEKWWHQGHGTIFEATDGSWWTVYHARLNGATGIGRQTLLMPIEWTKDGWPVVKDGIGSHELITAPKGENIGHGMALSDSFDDNKPGIQWGLHPDDEKYIKCKEGKLYLTAKGDKNDHRSGRSMYVGAVNKSFEATVKIELPDKNVVAGIAIGNDGILSDGSVTTYTEGPEWRMRDASYMLNSDVVYLKIKNWRGDLSFYFSEDGETWKNYGRGLHVSGYGIRLFAAGDGTAIFHDFRYQGLE